MSRSPGNARIQRDKRPAPIFTYKCTNCQQRNETGKPPEDQMLHCRRCGFLTVQVFYEVHT